MWWLYPPAPAARENDDAVNDVDGETDADAEMGRSGNCFVGAGDCGGRLRRDLSECVE